MEDEASQTSRRGLDIGDNRQGEVLGLVVVKRESESVYATVDSMQRTTKGVVALLTNATGTRNADVTPVVALKLPQVSGFTTSKTEPHP